VRLSRVGTHTLCAIGAGFSLATPVVAQHLTLSPTIGVYIPTSELVKAASGEEFKQEIGLAVGGRLGVDFSPRFGIVTSVSYIPSDGPSRRKRTQNDVQLALGFGVPMGGER
jgi:hypothetical protein